ncbi:hypothetical protein [Paraconexibacter sp.]|uniref:hypothetical protein n=1 Tax=Paraconexibacter sp. TaxID=2949640 RepID=UPI003566F9F0
MSAADGARTGAPRRPRGAGAPRAAKRLGAPVPVTVRADPSTGRPRRVDRLDVEAVRESWLVEDRWWTTVPLRRRYWEVVTVCGRDLTVFRDLEDGRWWRQR